MSKPWEEELGKIWNVTTSGKRKFLTYPLLLILIIVPAIGGMSKSYKEAWTVVKGFVSPSRSVPSKSESDVFNEWVIVVGFAEDEKKAKALSEQFKSVYVQSGHVNYKSEPIWLNDIFYVRHPTEKGYWIVVIDALSGEATKESVEAELGVLMELAFESRGSTNTYGHYLYGSKVIYYSKNDFINSYGKIVGQ